MSRYSLSRPGLGAMSTILENVGNAHTLTCHPMTSFDRSSWEALQSACADAQQDTRHMSAGAQCQVKSHRVQL